MKVMQQFLGIREKQKSSYRLRTKTERFFRSRKISICEGPSGRLLSAIRDYTSSGAFKLAGTSALPIISDLAKDHLADKTDMIALRVETEENYLSQLLQDHWAFQKRDTIDPINGRPCTRKNMLLEPSR